MKKWTIVTMLCLVGFGSSVLLNKSRVQASEKLAGNYCLAIGYRAAVHCTNHHVIALGTGAEPSRDYQLVITWDDGSETRLDLPRNKWIRGQLEFQKAYTAGIKNQ